MHDDCPVSASAHHRRKGASRHDACVWLDRCVSSRCEASWRRLLGRYGRRIRALIYLVGRDHGLHPTRAEVDELAQDLYLVWLHRGTRFRGRTFAEFWSFVATSVRRLVIDQVRRARADKRSPTPHGWHHAAPIDGSHGTCEEPAPPGDVSLRSAWTPEDRLLAAESYAHYQERLLQACREVMERDEEAEILAAILLDGYSSREVSRALARRGPAVSVSTLDSWVHRLRLRLAADGLRLPNRTPEPEGAWPPKLPSPAGECREAARGPARRCGMVSRPAGAAAVCTMGRS